MKPSLYTRRAGHGIGRWMTTLSCAWPALFHQRNERVLGVLSLAMDRTMTCHQIKTCHAIAGLLCFYLAVACADESSIEPGSSSTSGDSTTETMTSSVEESSASSTATSSDSTWVQDCENDIRFADPKVEEWVRYRANLPTGKLTRENLSEIVDVVATGASSLEGVQCLPWIRNVTAEHGEISDLSPLMNLRRLWHISLRNNRIRDISPISRGGVDAEIPCSFDLSGNPIADLRSFELPNLPAPEQYCSEFLLDDYPGTEADRQVAQSFCDAGWLVYWASTDVAIESISCDPGNCPPPRFIKHRSTSAPLRIGN